MTAAQLGRRLLWLLDLVTLAALFGTGEVDLRVVAGLAAILVLRAAHVRVRARGPLLALIVVAVAGAVGAVAWLRFHPLIAAVYGAIVVHALLWLGPDEARDRVLRLAMSFINLMLAAALTTDLYLLPVILLVSVLGSLYLAAAFLETRFHELAPELEGSRIPPGFLKAMTAVSVAIFVVSLALFPVIPRAGWRNPVDEGGGLTGYHETVELQPASAAPLRASFKPALRIAAAAGTGEDPVRSMPGRLLRGKDLELFDGERWQPRASKRVKGPWHEPFETQAGAGVGGSRFRVEQLSMGAGTGKHEPYFHPYGSRIAALDEEHGAYVYELGAGETDPVLTERPYDLHVRVPPSYRFPSLEGLARSLFAGARAPREKIHALARFYASGFQGTLESGGGPVATPERVIGEFLLTSKSGPCELFATSAAILLRMADVPSRVVAGYRASRFAAKGVLTITEGDAHAWVEYWEAGRGWVPFDPTPLRLVEADWAEPLREMYWRLDGLWDQWVLNYRKGSRAGQGATATPLWRDRVAEFIARVRVPRTEEAAAALPAALALAAAVLVAIAVWQLRRAGWKPAEWREARRLRGLKREYRAMAALLKPLLSRREDLVLRDLAGIVRLRLGEQAAIAFRDWEATFLRLRYGKQEKPAASRTSATDLDVLKNHRRKLSASIHLRRA